MHEIQATTASDDAVDSATETAEPWDSNDQGTMGPWRSTKSTRIFSTFWLGCFGICLDFGFGYQGPCRWVHASDFPKSKDVKSISQNSMNCSTFPKNFLVLGLLILRRPCQGYTCLLWQVRTFFLCLLLDPSNLQDHWIESFQRRFVGWALASFLQSLE